MPSLLEIQRGMAATIFGDDAALVALGVVAGGISAAARIDIYRNNVLGNYRKALAATFPVVRRLVGAAFFDAAIDAFVRAHPSNRGDVNRYGGDLARFLADYAPARSLGYLPDVARLEWAIDQAGIAADAPAFDFAALAALAEDAHASLRFVLHPSAQLIESRYPILHIWRVNQPDGHGPPDVDLGEGGDSLLVARGEHGVGVERLGPGETALLRALGRDAPLATAASRANQAEPSFHLPTALRRYVASHLLVAVRVQDPFVKGSPQ
ncbi:MAG: DNA-binding domain-containing protein [Betaproteobacteria bacterium]